MLAASYSSAKATESKSVNLPRNAKPNNAADAPSGLRRPATTTFVSNTHLTYSLCFPGPSMWSACPLSR